MKNLKRSAYALSILIALVCVSGCASDAEIAAETAKYTTETAQAIVAVGWKLSGAIFGGLILHALIS